MYHYNTPEQSFHTVSAIDHALTSLQDLNIIIINIVILMMIIIIIIIAVNP